MQSSPSVSQKDINGFLDEMHISHSLSGYTYLMDAILLVCSDSDLHERRRVMGLYEMVAEKNRTAASRVESSMRVALKQARCGRTNGEFIFWAADHLRYAATGQLS